MSDRSAVPPAHVPVLTDVIELPGPKVPSTVADDAGTSVHAAVPPVLDEARLVAEVLAELQHRVDAMLEHRLREALTPLLAKAADDMVTSAKAELAGTLRDVISRAVTQEIARQRNRG